MQETRNDVQEPMVLLKKICVYIQNSSFCISCKQSSHASLEQQEENDADGWTVSEMFDHLPYFICLETKHMNFRDNPPI